MIDKKNLKISFQEIRPEEEMTERLETARWAVLAKGQIAGLPRRLEMKIAKHLLGYLNAEEEGFEPFLLK